MEKYVRKIGYSSIVISILLIILSLFMIMKPSGTANVLMLILGYILLVDGIVHFISYFSIKSEYRFFSYELAQSIIYMVIGLLIVYNANTIAQTLPVFLGIWIILNGIFRIQIAFNITGLRNANWAIMLIMAFIEALFGVILVINPFTSLEALTVISGVFLLLSQIMDIYDDIFVLTQVGKVSKIIEDEEKANK